MSPIGYYRHFGHTLGQGSYVGVTRNPRPLVSFPRDLVSLTLSYGPHRRLALTVTRDPSLPFFPRSIFAW